MAQDNRKVKFVRIRGRVVPIRQRLSESAESASSIVGAASVSAFGVSKGISSKRMGKTRAKLSRASVSMSKVPRRIVQGTLTSPFKLRKFAVKSALVSTALSTLSFTLAPEKAFEDL